jgi:hypothetical protein
MEKEAYKRVYLDLGPASRELIGLYGGKKQEKVISKLKYLKKFEADLYSISKDRFDILDRLVGLVTWPKAIEADLINDEVLLSIPQELRDYTKK